MAIVNYSERNADGLNVYLGVNEGKPGAGGEYRSVGPNRQQEFILNLADLTTSAQYIDQHWELPKGAFIEAVEVEVLVVAASSGSGTLNIGLKQSDQTTNISDTALVAAATTAALAQGVRLTIVGGSTYVGANVGTALSVNGLVTAKAGTAVFQSGKVAVRIFYNFI